MAPVIPTMPFPPRIANGEFVLIEQDSQQDIEGSVELVARTPQGYLDSLPGMGLPDYALTRGVPSATEIRAAIEPYEPRASLVVDARLEDLVATVTIDTGTVTDGN